MVDRQVAFRWAERHRWGTLPTERIVLAIARTPASTIRLLEALTIFHGSPVQVLFTVDPTSAYCDGVADLISGKAMLVPWDEVGSLEYDLALTASENVNLDAITKPVVVLPHGIGFHKYVPDSSADRRRTSGVVPAKYLDDGRVWMVLSHPDQEEQLRRSHPETTGHCVVVGDTAYDRLIRSLRQRDYYRHRLGLRQGQRLIVVTSTWGDDSLLGSRPDLPQRLLAELPADEYRVALIQHPNIAAWHGGQRINQELAFADLSGLLRIPSAEGWQATMIAADLVVGDSGSVTLYGAALDRPAVLGAVATSIVPGTPPEELARAVALLSPDIPLREQVEHALKVHQPGRFDGLRNRMFAHQGHATEELRRFVFEKLGLATPARPALVTTAPPPRPTVREARSFRVRSRIVGPGRVEVRRFPVPAAERRDEPGYIEHLCTSEGESIAAVPENASVIVRETIIGQAGDWMARTLGDYEPYMAVAAVENGCLIQTRDGRSMRCTGARLDPLLASSGVYTLIRSGALADGPVVVMAGATEARFDVEIM